MAVIQVTHAPLWKQSHQMCLPIFNYPITKLPDYQIVKGGKL